MPSTIKENKNLVPDVVKITRAEAKKLIPQLEALKRGDLAEVRISDATQTLTILRGNNERVVFKGDAPVPTLTTTIADTTLAQNMKIWIAGHTFIEMLNAFRHWGDSETEFVLNFNDQAGFSPTLRFQLAAGS